MSEFKKNIAELHASDKWRAIVAAISTIGAVGVALGMGNALISSLMAAHGFSNRIIGYSGTVGGVATIIAATMTARIAVRFGVVRPILFMLFVGGLSFLGFYVFQNIGIWFVLRFILHFAITVMFVLSEFWVNSSAPPKKRGFVLAIYAITLGIGVAVGPTIFSFVGNQGFLPFATGCIIIAAASIPIFMAWNLGPQFHESEHAAFLPYIFKVPTSTMAVLVYGAIQIGAMTLTQPFAKALHYDDVQAAHFLTVLVLGNVLLLVPIGMISDRVKDRRYPLAGCALIGALGTLLVPYIYDNWLYLSIDLFILGGVSAGLYTVGLAQLGARLKGSELASANSAFIFCYGIGMLMGPSIIGDAMDRFPPFGFAHAMAVFFGLYVLLVVSRLFLKLFRS